MKKPVAWIFAFGLASIFIGAAFFHRSMQQARQMEERDTPKAIGIYTLYNEGKKSEIDRYNIYDELTDRENSLGTIERIDLLDARANPLAGSTMVEFKVIRNGKVYGERIQFIDGKPLGLSEFSIERRLESD